MPGSFYIEARRQYAFSEGLNRQVMTGQSSSHFSGFAIRKGLKPFNARAGHFSGRHSFGHNAPAAAAGEVFKPSTDSAGLVVPSQKKFFSVLGLGFSWGDKWGVLAFLWPNLPGPGRPSNGPTFWPKYVLETRLSYEFLEPLIGFLAYLDQKLCHKNQKVVKISTPKKVTRVE